VSCLGWEWKHIFVLMHDLRRYMITQLDKHNSSLHEQAITHPQLRIVSGREIKLSNREMLLR